MKQLFPFSVNDPLPTVKRIKETTAYGFIDYTGKDIIDLGLGSSGCFPLGFKRIDLVESVTEKLKEFPFCQSDFVTANTATIELSDTLYQLSNGYYPVYSLSGSDAIEGAVKLVQLFWKGKRSKILCFADSYHGSTFMSASVSGSDYLTNIYGRHPDCYTISDLAEITQEVAAVIIETCSWQAGLVDRGQSFFTELRHVCDKTGALLIIDDIAFCGGKTGTIFGFQIHDAKPDIFCIGKGITGGYFPLSATLCNQKVADLVKPQTLLHGFSYSFPMAGILSVLEYLQILKKECILTQVNDTIIKANTLFDSLLAAGMIKEYKSFGVCYKVDLINEIYDYLEKDKIFYEHGLHIGLWNNDASGVLIMLPLNATDDYFLKLKEKLTSVIQYLK